MPVPEEVGIVRVNELIEYFAYTVIFPVTEVLASKVVPVPLGSVFQLKKV